MATRAPTYMPPGAANDSRFAPRLRVTTTNAMLRCAGGSTAETLLHDVSVYGCRLEAETNHEAGDRVSVQLAGSEPVPATVVWNSDRRIACRFDRPIPRALMRSLLRRLI